MTTNNAYGVIMAGGSGTRFWPLSRADRPKQLLPLGEGDDSLLAATCQRLQQLLPPERILVVTSERLGEATRAALPQLPAENIMAEPVGRNTAPCVGWAAARVARLDPKGVLAVLPADHHIGDEPGYLTVIEQALDVAHDGHLVTVGIRPTRAETGYGYIEIGDPLGEGVFRARRFVEKPNEARARQFLDAGTFFWNSGMFFFQADVVLEAIRQHLPGLGSQLADYDEAARTGGDEARLIADTYASLPDVSIDHGVMEKVDDVAVIPGSFGWSDLGSWTTAWELAPHDGDQNAIEGDVINVESTGCYVRGPQGKVVAVVGLSDLVVVDTEDALLVVPRERAQDVRAVVKELKARSGKQPL